MPFGSLLFLVLLIIGVIYFQKHPDATSRARFLRRTAFGIMAFVTFFFGLVVVAETISDPGGLAAVGWIAAWFVPLAGLVALAWYGPTFALRAFVALTVAVLGLTVWTVVQSDPWRTFEDDHGPVRTIIVFVLAAAIAVFGLQRPREAGWLLVILGVVPLALSSLAGNFALGSLVVAVTPTLIAGVLYLISAHLDGGRAPAPPPTRPKDLLGVG
jgi:hypothetical protein